MANVKFLISTRFADFVTSLPIEWESERESGEHVRIKCHPYAPATQRARYFLYQHTPALQPKLTLTRERRAGDTACTLAHRSMRANRDGIVLYSIIRKIWATYCWIFKIKLSNKFIRKVTYSNDMYSVCFSWKLLSDTIVIINNREMRECWRALASRSSLARAGERKKKKCLR